MILKWWNVVRTLVVLLVAWSIWMAFWSGGKDLLPSAIVSVWQLTAAWLLYHLFVKRDRKYRLWDAGAWSYSVKADMEYFATKMATALEADVETARDVLRRAQPVTDDALREAEDFRESYGSWVEPQSTHALARLITSLRDLKRLLTIGDEAQFLCGAATASIVVYGTAITLEHDTRFYRPSGDASVLTRLRVIQDRWIDESARNRIEARKF